MGGRIDAYGKPAHDHYPPGGKVLGQTLGDGPSVRGGLSRADDGYGRAVQRLLASFMF